MCYINVVGSGGTGDNGDSCIPGTSWSDVISDGLYLYRSVNVNNPFPNGAIPQNWNNEHYISRLKNSYSNNLDYKTQVLNLDIVNKLRDINDIYTNWNDTNTGYGNPSGKNIYIVNDYYSKINGKYCKYGFFDDKCS